MKDKIISIVISPEVLKTEIVEESLNGIEFGVYSGFSDTLTGVSYNSALITGVTIPILLTQTYNDIGHYNEFEGFIAQTDITKNFVVSGNSSFPYTVSLYNSYSYNPEVSLVQTNYIVDWGDGSSSTQLNLQNEILLHTYNTVPSEYTITMTQATAFGITEVKKQVNVPLTGVTTTNIFGDINFIPQYGSWAGMPLNYKYIFTGDSNTNINDQTSNNYTQVPFAISGLTNSKLNLLRRYGSEPYVVGYVVNIGNNSYGQVDEIDPSYTAYSINNIHYIDFKNQTTAFYYDSSGITASQYIIPAIAKNEAMLDFVMDPEIESNVYVERGKYSPTEVIQRLGEVDNLGDLKRYGYGFFKFFGG
jgi:hypothetical protein